MVKDVESLARLSGYKRKNKLSKKRRDLIKRNLRVVWLFLRIRGLILVLRVLLNQEHAINSSWLMIIMA